jgi:hypothetical protein
MRFAAELRVCPVIFAGNAHTRRPRAVQCPCRGGSSSRSLCHRTGHSRHAGQTIRNHRQLEVLVDVPDAASAALTYPADGFSPSEMLFDTLADDLADPVARVARGATVDGVAARTLIVARDMRRYVAGTAITHEVARVIGLVGTLCLRMRAGRAIEQPQGAPRSAKPSL